MQIAAEASPLFLARRHEAFAGGAQVFGQQRRVAGHPDLLGEIVEQAEIGDRHRVGR